MTAVVGTKTIGGGFTNAEEIHKIVYDFAVDAGATGALDIFTAKGNVIVTGFHAHVITACTSGGSATVEVGVSGSTAAVMAQTAVAALTANACKGFVGPVRLADGATLKQTIATAALTAGKIEYTVKIQRALA